MSNTQEISEKVQEQTLDAVRKTRDVVVEAVTTWAESAKSVPTTDDIVKQFPSLSEIIDSNFEFAQRLLNNQRDFAHRLIAATTSKPVAVAASKPVAVAPQSEAAAPKAIEAAAAPAKKAAAAKTTTAAKKTTATRPAGTATT